MSASRLHATCVVLGEAGLLLRGPSGSGKSRLARDLLEEADRAGLHAALVCDDRVEVEPCHGRLVARAVPAIAGLLEVRGLGLLPVAHRPAAVIRLVVDCLERPGPRMPEPPETTTIISGIALERIGARVEPGLAAGILPRMVSAMSRSCNNGHHFVALPLRAALRCTR